MPNPDAKDRKVRRTADGLRNICISLPALSLILLVLSDLDASAKTQHMKVLFIWEAAEWIPNLAYSAAIAALVCSAALRAGENSPLLPKFIKDIRDDALPAQVWFCAIIFWVAFSIFDSNLGPGISMRIMWVWSGIIGCLVLIAAVLATIFHPMDLLSENAEEENSR